MAILNVTPDSFADGGELYGRLETVIDRAAQYLHSGASILDIGGESTRPGASPVSEAEELDRVIPVVEAIKSRFDCFVSIDTSTPIVMREGALRGVDIINDVRALTREGALEAASDIRLPVCLMHMQGTPVSMQKEPQYDNVVNDVLSWLLKRIEHCFDHGIEARRIAIDPGFGFGKKLEHNIELFRGLEHFIATGYPVMVGVSRKSMIGEIINRPVKYRGLGSAVAAALAAHHGAKIVRVHDVEQTIEAIAVMQALAQEK